MNNLFITETPKPPKDLPLSNTYPPPTDNTTTPSADLYSMSSNSSVSKDSLLNPSSPEKSTSEGVQPPPSKMPEGGACTAFTVDFGEESPKKPMAGKSLSEFMPSKIRKSFKDRKEKVLGTKTGKEATGKDSSPGSEKVRILVTYLHSSKYVYVMFYIHNSKSFCLFSI